MREALAVTHLFGLFDDTKSAVLNEVKSVVVTWKTIAGAIGMGVADIDAFAPAFEHPEL